MKAFGILLSLFRLVGTPSMASARDDDRVEASLSGYNEVHLIFAAGPPASAAIRGAVSTPAKGRFKAKIDKKSALIEYELSYQDLVGAVTQAHIHLARPARWAASWCGSVRPRGPPPRRRWPR